MEPDFQFWRKVKQDIVASIATSGLVALTAGIIYLVYTVPRKLDEVLINQVRFEKQIGRLEDRVLDHENRLIKLELR
jgi:hypothetical protein